MNNHDEQTEGLTRQEKAFISVVGDLSQDGVIRWQRKGDELLATVVLRLSVSDPAGNSIHILTVDGGITRSALLPIPIGILEQQFVELDVTDGKLAIGETA